MWKFFESIVDFFTGGDTLPWCSDEDIEAVDRQAAEALLGSDEEHKTETLVRLSFLLVHSARMEEIERGLAILEEELSRSDCRWRVREILYLLAVGYYRRGNCSKGRAYVETVLMAEPEFKDGQELLKVIENRGRKDGLVLFGVAVTAVVMVASAISECCGRSTEEETAKP